MSEIKLWDPRSYALNDFTVNGTDVAGHSPQAPQFWNLPSAVLMSGSGHCHSSIFLPPICPISPRRIETKAVLAILRNDRG